MDCRARDGRSVNLWVAHDLPVVHGGTAVPPYQSNSAFRRRSSLYSQQCQCFVVQLAHLIADNRKLPRALRLRFVRRSHLCEMRRVTERFHLSEQELELEI